MPGVRLFLVLIGLVVAGSVAPAQPAKPAALKLPDGTIVVFTKSPDDLNPVPDGVLLPAAEYKALQDQVDAARKARESIKPVAPSSCDIRGKVVARGDRLSALLTLTYTVRTSTPRTAVALGTARAFPTAARLPDGRLPVLSSADDGLTVTVEKPGDQTVALEVEAPVTARGLKGELGFEMGLPRAAITTLAIELPAGVKKAQVGLRSPGERVGDKPLETKWTAEDSATLAVRFDTDRSKAPCRSPVVIRSVSNIVSEVVKLGCPRCRRPTLMSTSPGVDRSHESDPSSAAQPRGIT